MERNTSKNEEIPTKKILGLWLLLSSMIERPDYIRFRFPEIFLILSICQPGNDLSHRISHNP